MDIVPDVPFSFIMSNFGHQPIHLPNHTVIGLALPSPTHILALHPGTRVVEAKEGRGSIVPTGYEGGSNKNPPSSATVQESQAKYDSEEDEGDNTDTDAPQIVD